MQFLGGKKKKKLLNLPSQGFRSPSFMEHFRLWTHKIIRHIVWTALLKDERFDVKTWDKSNQCCRPIPLELRWDLDNKRTVKLQIQTDRAQTIQGMRCREGADICICPCVSVRDVTHVASFSFRPIWRSSSQECKDCGHLSLSRVVPLMSLSWRAAVVSHAYLRQSGEITRNKCSWLLVVCADNKTVKGTWGPGSQLIYIQPDVLCGGHARTKRGLLTVQHLFTSQFIHNANVSFQCRTGLGAFKRKPLV